MIDPHDPYGTLTPIQRRLTLLIHDTGGWANTIDVAKSAGISVSHANRTLNILVDGGTLTRRRNPIPNPGIPAHQWRCQH